MRWKWILGIPALVIVVVIAGGYILLSTYNFEYLKPEVVKAVKDATGRKLTIGGNIKLEVGLTPALAVNDVSFQNSSWGSRPEMAKIKRFEVQVALLPLLSKKIEIKRLILVQPDILIETNKAGVSNLAFETERKAPSAQSGGEQEKAGAGIPALALSRLQIEKGHFTYRDGRTGATFALNIEKLNAYSPGAQSPMQISLQGAYNNRPFKLDGTMIPLAALSDHNTAWPLKITFKAAGATFAVKGKLKDLMGARSFSLNFDAKGPSVSDLAKWGGVATVPQLGPFRISGDVSAPAAKVYRIANLKASLAGSDLEGTVDLHMAGKRPKVSGSLSSQKVDLRPLLAKSEKGAGGPPKAAKTSTKSGKVFSSKPLSFAPLESVDADLRVSASQIIAPKAVLNDLNSNILLHDGSLTLKPLKARFAGGTLDGRVKLLPKGKEATLDVLFKGTHVDLAQLAKTLKMSRKLEGKADVDINIRGSGDSVAQIMSDLNGKTVVVVQKGQLDNKYLDLLGGDIGTNALKLINPFSHKTKDTKINCMVSGFVIKNGLAQTTALLLDTDAMRVIGDGQINLKTEKLDISLHPSPKQGAGTSGLGKLSMSLGELTKPFKLGGSLAKPALAIDTKQAALEIGKAAGGAALLGPIGLAASMLSGSAANNPNACSEAIDAAYKGVKFTGAQKTKEQEKKTGASKKGIGSELKKFFGR